MDANGDDWQLLLLLLSKRVKMVTGMCAAVCIIRTSVHNSYVHTITHALTHTYMHIRHTPMYYAHAPT